MALHTQFHRKLAQLWKRQTEKLRTLIKPKPGKPLAFTRQFEDQPLVHARSGRPELAS